MKNFINYYYGFNIHNIYFSNEKYFFYNDQTKYVLKPCYNSSISIYYQELSYQLEKYRYFFSIILNRENNYITWIENKPYILLKLSNIVKLNKNMYVIKWKEYYEYFNEI